MNWNDYVNQRPESWNYGKDYAGKIGQSYTDAYGELSQAQKDSLSDESEAKWADLVAYVKGNVPKLKNTMNDITATNAAQQEIAGTYDDKKQASLDAREVNAAKRGMANQYSEFAAANKIIGGIEAQKARAIKNRALELRKEDAANKLNMFGAELNAFNTGLSNRQGQFDRYAGADAQVLANKRQDAMNSWQQAQAKDSTAAPPSLSNIKL